MVDNELLNQYRDGVRRLLQSGAKEEVRSSVPEFQSIIFEEVLAFAKKEIVGVYDCAKVKLLTDKTREILKEKITSKIDLKFICLSHNGCHADCDSLQIFKKLPPEMAFQDSRLTIIVVDGSITLAIGDCSGDPLLLYPGGLEGFTQQALKFVNELWAYARNDSSNSIDVEGSHS